MIALLRKDAPWHAALLTGGAVVLTIVLCSYGPGSIWHLPPARLDELFHTSWIQGAVLGLFASVWDELLGTRDFLRHRPIARERLHGGRVLACVLVLLCWTVIPPALHFAIDSLHLRQAGDPAHVFALWACMATAWSACAVGLFAGTLPCGHLLRIVFGAGAFLAWFTLADAVAVDTQWRHDPAKYSALHVAGALLFTCLSFASAERNADPDRPWPAAARRYGGGIAALALAFTAALALNSLQNEDAGEYRRSLPRLTEVEGEVRLVHVEYQGNGGVVRWLAGPDHRPVGEPLAPERMRELQTWGSQLRHRDLLFDPVRFRFSPHWGGGVLHEDGRYYRLLWQSSVGRRFVRVGKGERNEPFAAGAQLVEVRVEKKGVGPDDRARDWIVEPGADVAWRFDVANGAFAPVPLPDGDRVTTTAVLQVEMDEHAQGIGIAGERGIYVVDGDAIVRAPAGARRVRQEAPAERVETVHDDVLCPSVRVVAADGTVRFEHAFAPRTLAERWYAGWLLACSLARPLPLQLAAFAASPAERTAGEPRSRDFPPLLDPLLASGRRTWLLLATAAVGALCAFLAARRLRRFGAPPPVRRFWGTLAFVLGPAGLVASALVERRRAYAPSPSCAPGVAAPPPRIASPRG